MTVWKRILRYLILLVGGSKLSSAGSGRPRRLVRDGATTSKRDGELESFAHMCLERLSRIDSLTQEDYARFLGEFCQQSTIKGPACPSTGETAFSLLPIDLQLLYVGCQSHVVSQQIDCLQFQIDTDEPIPFRGKIEILCAQSFTAMKSSYLLEARQHVAYKTVASASGSDIQPRGVWNGNDHSEDESESDHSKAAKERKEDSRKRTSDGSAVSTVPPSVSPSTLLPSMATTSSSTRDPLASLPAPTAEPTSSPFESSTYTSDRAAEPNDPQTNLTSPAIIGAAALGLLVLAFAALKVSKRSRRMRPYAGGGSEKSDVLFPDNASILSEPSALFKFEQNLGYSLDDSVQTTSKKAWFQDLIRPHQRTIASKQPRFKFWKTPAWKNGSMNGGSVSSTSSHHGLSNTDDKVDEYPFFAEAPTESGNKKDEVQIPEAYHIDLYPTEERVSSSLSSASKSGNKRSIETLFKERGSLFSRDVANKVPDLSKPEDNLHIRESTASPELVDYAFPSREACHENAILEGQGAADYHNEKPWRKDGIRQSATCNTLEIEAPTMDDIETSFLSPDIVQRFRDVDQCLSDGLRQVREQDHKLGLDVEKFQAGMSDRKTADEKRHQMDSSERKALNEDTSSSIPSDNLSEKSENQNNPAIKDDVEGPNESCLDTSERNEGQIPRLGKDDSAEVHNGDRSNTDDHDDEAEDLHCEEEEGRSFFAPTWIHKEQSEAWNASRSALSLPRHSFFDDTGRQQQSSLLPPRVDSMDSTEND